MKPVLPLSRPLEGCSFRAYKDLLTSAVVICPVQMPSSGTSVRMGRFSGASLDK